jgi:hypothetical protein
MARRIEDEAMTDYRLDPKNPRQLTPEEARQLAETPIDYSDIPPLFGEDWLSARLLEIVCEHCGTTGGGELDSGAIPAHADLMRLCAEGGDIEITRQCGAHIIAKVTPEGRALLDRLRAERERDRQRGAQP